MSDQAVCEIIKIYRNGIVLPKSIYSCGVLLDPSLLVAVGSTDSHNSVFKLNTVVNYHFIRLEIKCELFPSLDNYILS